MRVTDCVHGVWEPNTPQPRLSRMQRLASEMTSGGRSSYLRFTANSAIVRVAPCPSSVCFMLPVDATLTFMIPFP